MQTNQQTVPTVLPIPQTIGAELQAGGPKVSTKETGTKGVVKTVKTGLDLQKVADKVADALESKRTTMVTTFLEAAKQIKEPANIVDAQKVLNATLKARRFPSADTRASEFASVAYAWHHDAKGTEIAILQDVPKMKDGKEVLDDKGKPIMVKPSETIILKRIRVIRSRIPEGEPGFTRKGSRDSKTATKLNATQYARLLDYLKIMDAEQWDKFGEAYQGEVIQRAKAANKKTK